MTTYLSQKEAVYDLTCTQIRKGACNIALLKVCDIDHWYEYIGTDTAMNKRFYFKSVSLISIYPVIVFVIFLVIIETR